MPKIATMTAPVATGLAFSIAQPTLQHLLSNAARVVENRPSLPILANLLLDAHNGVLTVSGSSIAMTVIADAPCEVGREGTIALPAATLTQIVSTFERHALVEIAVDEATWTAALRCGKAQVEVSGMAGDDFPLVGDFETTFSTAINAEPLCKGIRDTVYAADQKDDLKPILSSLALRFTSDGLFLLATDSLRGAAMVLRDCRKEKPFDLVIQQRFVREAEAMFRANGDAEMTVSTGKAGRGGEMACFEAAGLRFFCQTPGIQPRLTAKFMEQTTTCQIEVDAKQLARVLARTAIMARENEFRVDLAFTPESLDVQGSGKERGRAFDSLPGTLKGSPVEMACNLEFFQQALASFDVDRISIENSGAASALVLRSVERPELLAAISPIGQKQ